MNHKLKAIDWYKRLQDTEAGNLEHQTSISGQRRYQKKDNDFSIIFMAYLDF